MTRVQSVSRVAMVLVALLSAAIANSQTIDIDFNFRNGALGRLRHPGKSDLGVVRRQSPNSIYFFSGSTSGPQAFVWVLPDDDLILY